MLYQLLYVSVQTRSYSEDDLVALLEQSQKNNKVLGVTGILVYHKKHFLQILEGEKDTIFELFRKIRRDDRHLSVILFWDQKIEKRMFGQWEMAFVDLDNVDSASLEGFSSFLQEGFGKISDENLTTAQKLLIKCSDFLK